MNSLDTLFFPGTEIYSIRQYPIFLLFQKLHLIKPVEDDPAGSGDEFSDSFIKSGFCQVHTPCPLGEHRDRFLHLIEDIRNRKDDYAAQLSSLVLAANSGRSAIDEDSERGIIASLLTPEDQKAKALLADKEGKLWQARLVLAIGEILDLEEEEIAANLATLEDDQAGLFRALHGEIEELEEDNPFAELNQLENNMVAANTGNIKKRFNGWKTLFLESDMPECEVFFTTSQDAGDLLLELYEQKANQPALLAATLDLPGLIGWNGEEASYAVVTFHEDNRKLLSRIHQRLADLAQQKDFPNHETKTDNVFAAMTEEWNAQLENIFPANKFGRNPVKCYLFPGLTCSTVIGKSQSPNGGHQNGLLIVTE
jgi:plasmid stability protein